MKQHVTLTELGEIKDRFVSDELKLTLCRILKKHDGPKMDVQLAGMIASFGICDSYTRSDCSLSITRYCDAGESEQIGWRSIVMSNPCNRVIQFQHQASSHFQDGDGVPAMLDMEIPATGGHCVQHTYVNCKHKGRDGPIITCYFEQNGWRLYEIIYMKYGQSQAAIWHQYQELEEN